MTPAIDSRLQEILRDDLRVDTSTVTRQSHLIDEVGLDSVAFAVGMVAIEEKLGVTLSEEDLMACETIGDLESVVLGKLA